VSVTHTHTQTLKNHTKSTNIFWMIHNIYKSKCIFAGIHAFLLPIC